VPIEVNAPTRYLLSRSKNLRARQSKNRRTAKGAPTGDQYGPVRQKGHCVPRTRLIQIACGTKHTVAGRRFQRYSRFAGGITATTQQHFSVCQRTAVGRSRGSPMLPLAANVPLAGSYNSTVAKALLALSEPRAEAPCRQEERR